MNSILIAMNIIKRLLREFIAFVFLVLFPVLAGVFAVIMFGQTDAVSIGIANLPESGHEMVQYIERTGRFEVHQVLTHEVEHRIKAEEIMIGVILPENFEDKFNKKSIEKIKLVSRKENMAVQELRGLLENYVTSSYTGEKKVPDERVKKDIQKQRTAMGMLTMFIVISASTGMGLILEDKKWKTFMRIFCAPLKGYEVVLGNLLANTILGVFQISLFLLITKYILKIDWLTSLGNVFVILFMFLLTSIGLGIGLAGLIQDNQKYSIINSMVGVFTCFLGGSFIPVELMNQFLQKVSFFIPQKWLMEAYGKLIDGATLADIQINLLILLLFGAVFFTFGVKTLRPTEEDL